MCERAWTSCYSTGNQRPHRCFRTTSLSRPTASTCLRHRPYNGEYMLSMSTRYVWTYPSIYPKVLFPVEDPGPRLIRGSLGPPESKPRPNGVWIDSALLYGCMAVVSSRHRETNRGTLVSIRCILCHSSSVFTCIGSLGTPSRTGPLARKYLPGFPYS